MRAIGLAILVCAIGWAQETRKPKAPLAGRVVKLVTPMGIAESAREQALTILAIQPGDVLTNEGTDRAEEELRKFDRRIQLTILAVGDNEAQVFLYAVNSRR